MRRSSLPIALLAIGLAVGGVACGSDDNSSTTTAAAAATTSTTTTVAAATASNPGPVDSASPQLCAARETLRTSITDLSKVNPVADGTGAVKDQLATIRENLKDVRAEAGSDVQSQTDAFEKSLDSLETALDKSGADKVTAVASALGDVATSGATLMTSLGNLSCP